MSTQDSGNSRECFPSLCKSGCGFFSGIDSKGFCSVCFKDYLKKEGGDEATDSTADHKAEPEDIPATVEMSALTLEDKSEDIQSEKSESQEKEDVAEVKQDEAAALPGSSNSVATAGSTEDKDKEAKDTKKKKNRCMSCKKKLGLTGFACRCGGLFCAIHRYTDKHDCSFDYKAMGEKEISENNPLIVAEKVAKI